MQTQIKAYNLEWWCFLEPFAYCCKQRTTNWFIYSKCSQNDNKL